MKLSVQVCADLCRRLMAEGVEDFQFYTLNRPHLTLAVCAELGIHPEGQAAASSGLNRLKPRPGARLCQFRRTTFGMREGLST